MELGGNIELIGFDDLDPGHQIVSKKIIGNYVKRIQEKYKDYESIKLELVFIKSYVLKGFLKLKKKTMEIEGEDLNLFQAISNCLNNIL